jgi:galactonate dehydratase
MKLARIETFFVPPRWLFVRVETQDGAFGWGEASLEGHAEAVAGAFESFRDRFIGYDARRIEDIWQIAYRGGFYRGGPVLMSALAGFEQALWDLKGRAYGLPVWEMLGGQVRERIRAYAWIGGDRPDEIGAAAAARRGQGFNAVKMNATAEMDFWAPPRRSTKWCSVSRRRRRKAWMSASISTAASTKPWPSSSPRCSSRLACCSSRNRC